MRRKDREMDVDFALNVVDKCGYAVMGMVLSDGMPYCVPINIVREANFIYFHSALDGKKTDALRKCPRICLTCVDNMHIVEEKFTTAYESAIITGNAKELTEEAEKIKVLRLICEKHTPGSMQSFERFAESSLSHTAVWKIAVDKITGKCNKQDVK